MTNKKGTFLLISCTTLLLSACSPPSQSGKIYSRDQTRTAQQIFNGTIRRIEHVSIEGTNTGGGTLGGGALGGVLGSAFGSGVGRGVATIGGAIGGAIAGTAAEKKITTVDGLEIEVLLDNGEALLVVQEKDAEYAVGDKVRVIKGADGTTRIRP